MVPAGNKAKRLSSVNHTTKTIHHHHHQGTKFLGIIIGENQKPDEYTLFFIRNFGHGFYVRTFLLKIYHFSPESFLSF